MVGRFFAPTIQPEVLDALAQKLLDRYSGKLEGIPDRHPKDQREGSVERAIKSVGGNFGALIDRDQTYLEQYLHPDRDILPPTQARPTHVRPHPGVPYREPEYGEQHRQHIGSRPRQTANVSGLGRYQEDTTSPGKTTAWDESPPVHDLWDFDTNSPLIGDSPSVLDPAVKVVLQQSGQPFAVYGPRARQDIELLSPKLERELLKRRRAPMKSTRAF